MILKSTIEEHELLGDTDPVPHQPNSPLPKMLTGAPLMVIYKKICRRYATSRCL